MQVAVDNSQLTLFDVPPDRTWRLPEARSDRDKRIAVLMRNILWQHEAGGCHASNEFFASNPTMGLKCDVATIRRGLAHLEECGILRRDFDAFGQRTIVPLVTVEDLLVAGWEALARAIVGMKQWAGEIRSKCRELLRSLGKWYAPQRSQAKNCAGSARTIARPFPYKERQAQKTTTVTGPKLAGVVVSPAEVPARTHSPVAVAQSPLTPREKEIQTMKPLITKAPKKASSTTKPVTPPPPVASSTPAKPAAVKATAAKPKLVARPKPKVPAKPATRPVETPVLGPPVVVTPPPTTVPATAASTNGPLHQIPPESPTPPPTEIIEPVLVTKPLIITIPPESPTPPADTVILPPSGDKKASGYAVVESELIQPSSEAVVPAGYLVVESDSTPPVPAPAESEATGLPLMTPSPTATEDATKPANCLVVESEIKPQVIGDAAVPGGYTVIESETADTTKPGYSVVESDSTPTVMIPAGQAMEDISSIQIGDVLIIAVKVQAKQEPEATA